jgi:DNA-binding transcriptional ArsR family regulator
MAKRRMSTEERATVFKALSDPLRVDIVDALAKSGPSCGTELSEKLGVSIALLCHHWDVLMDAGILKKERVGQLRICTLDQARLREATGGWASTAEPAVPTRRAVAKRVTKKRTKARTT